ncbi:MAG: M67 family metallopeptidase [Bacteroidetes bacterium]|nr:M67 family metallopeptidase [Bacteroidota bacterium]
MTKESVRQIEQHGEHTYPEECCGILLGVNKDGVQKVETVIELDNNQDENRRRRFFVTPKQYLQAERMAVERGLELLGFYHSHPDHPAIPSAFDTEHALPCFIYVIVSVAEGKAKSMTAWLLSGTRERFDERSLSIEKSTANEVGEQGARVENSDK